MTDTNTRAALTAEQARAEQQRYNETFAGECHEMAVWHGMRRAWMIRSELAKLPAGDGLTDEQSKWHSLSCGLRTSIRLGCTCKAAPRQPGEMGAGVQLKVFYGPMPESNGKSNYTAILYRDNGNDVLDIVDGVTLEVSEYPDRVRYEADRARFLIGELAERPDILAYDADKHSGYVEPAASAQQDGREAGEPPLGGRWHHGNGVVVCGTLRVFGEDFDTDPAQEFKEQLLTWVCDTLNAAQDAYRAAGAVALTDEECRSVAYLNDISQPPFMHSKHISAANRLLQRLLAARGEAK